MWTYTYTIERGEMVGILDWHIPHPTHFFIPENTIYSQLTEQVPSIWFIQSVQVNVATLTSKDQATSLILIDEELSTQVPAQYLSF